VRVLEVIWGHGMVNNTIYEVEACVYLIGGEKL
jgi:hypothetical protein